MRPNTLNKYFWYGKKTDYAGHVKTDISEADCTSEKDQYLLWQLVGQNLASYSSFNLSL